MANRFLWQQLGQYISEQRDKADLTRKDVSQKLGISLQFYGNVERGIVGCPESILKKLIPLLKLQPSKFVSIYTKASKLEALRLLKEARNGKSRA